MPTANVKLGEVLRRSLQFKASNRIELLEGVGRMFMLLSLHEVRYTAGIQGKTTRIFVFAPEEVDGFDQLPQPYDVGDLTDILMRQLQIVRMPEGTGTRLWDVSGYRMIARVPVIMFIPKLE